MEVCFLLKLRHRVGVGAEGGGVSGPGDHVAPSYIPQSAKPGRPDKLNAVSALRAA